MGQWEQINWYLQQKLQILENIAANTETQFRFIRKREMKGLGRVLGERELLLKELAMVNMELLQDETWQKRYRSIPIIQEIIYKEQEVQVRSRQVIQEAILEKFRMASELKSGKIHRQVTKQYVNPWSVIGRGSRINTTG